MALLVAVWVAEAFLAAARPVTAAEALTYDRFVRPTLSETLHQASENPDVLYTLIEKRSVGLFRVSEFALRLPALLSGALYLWAVRRLFGKRIWAVPVAIAPMLWQMFSSANGLGLAVALSAWAVEAAPKRLAWSGACLGLAVAAHTCFAIPAAVMAVILAWRYPGWERVVEKLLIPAVVASFIFLVLPLSLTPQTPSVPPQLDSAGVAGVRAAVETLRKDTDGRRIRVQASAAVIPVLDFYQAHWRVKNWQVSNGAADYYIETEVTARAIVGSQLVIIQRVGGIVLAR